MAVKPNDKGYTAAWLASKHGLSLMEARALLREVGPDRQKLTTAALKLSRAKRPALGDV